MNLSEKANSTVSGSTPSGAGRRAERYILPAAIFLLLVSVVVNVLLARKVHSFHQFAPVKLADVLIHVGTSVPPITAKRLDGQVETISFEATDRPTVLYVFTPPCIWCARNMDNLRALTNAVRDKYRFVGIALSGEGLPQYVAKNELRFPVYSGLSPETVKAYRLHSTPQTLVISPEGKVLQNWPGAYVGAQQSQVEAFFHVTLPGLREQAEAAGKN